MKKYLLTIILVITACAFWNLPYFEWHVWQKWKTPPEANLYLTPKILPLSKDDKQKPNWKMADFLEVKISLPENPEKIEGIKSSGIFIEYDNFSIGVIGFLTGRNCLKDLFNDKYFIEIKEHFDLEVNSCFDLSFDVFNTTPDMISFFDGSKNTSNIIGKLYIKSITHRYYTSTYTFESKSCKGFVAMRNDTRDTLQIYSLDERKLFSMSILFNDINQEQRTYLATTMISSIIFTDLYPDKSSIKNRLDEMIKENNIWPN